MVSDGLIKWSPMVSSNGLREFHQMVSDGSFEWSPMVSSNGLEGFDEPLPGVFSGDELP